MTWNGPGQCELGPVSKHSILEPQLLGLNQYAGWRGWESEDNSFLHVFGDSLLDTIDGCYV